jgi:hypothetical protein
VPDTENAWVDFKVIKAAVTMAQVLEHYGHTQWKSVSVEELRGACPLPHCKAKRSFNWNTTKNAFQCFTCKARGNVLDLVAKMENCSVRDAALKLSEWFKLEDTQPAGNPAELEAVEEKPQGEFEESDLLLVTAWVKFQNGEGRLINVGPFATDSDAKEWEHGFMQALLVMNKGPLWVIKAECEINFSHNADLPPSEAVEVLLKSGGE